MKQQGDNKGMCWDYSKNWF